MKRCYSQLELISVLEANPLGLSVNLNELSLSGGDYIFLDGILNKLVSSDDEATIMNQIQIQIYVDDFDQFNQLLSYLQGIFTASWIRYKEDHYNVAVATIDLRITEWQ